MRERFSPDETPTTQDVLDRWMHSGLAYSEGQKRAEFYRWLAEHDNDTARRMTERNRAVEVAGVDTDTHWSNGMPRLLTPEAYERLHSAAALAALTTKPKRVLITEPHDGHPNTETCPGCPHAPTGGE